MPIERQSQVYGGPSGWLAGYAGFVDATGMSGGVEFATWAAIQGLVVGHCARFDARDRAGLLRLFTDDAVFSSYRGTVRGLAELGAYYDAMFGLYDWTVHLVANTLIASDVPDRARAASYVHTAVQPVDGTPPYAFFASYDDQLEYGAGRWYISAREVLVPTLSATGGVGYQLTLGGTAPPLVAEQ